MKKLVWRLTPLTNNTAFLRHLAALLGAIMVMVGCSTIRYVPTNTETVYNYVDSLIYHLDTIKVEIPTEVYRDYTGLLDTLRLETSVASSWSAVDTSTMTLKGELKNKEVEIEKEVLWKERIVYKDSLVYKEIPVEVTKEVKKTPKWAWWSLALNILTILGIALKLYLKR